MENLHALLKEARIHGHKTQKEMAAHLDIQQSTYAKMETGQSSVDLVRFLKAIIFTKVPLDTCLPRELKFILNAIRCDVNSICPKQKDLTPVRKLMIESFKALNNDAFRDADLWKRLEEIDSKINWSLILRETDYEENLSLHPETGDVVVLLKISLLQEFYQLTDDQLMFHLNDSIGFKKFAGLNFDENVPDIKLIRKFKKKVVVQEIVDQLLEMAV